MTESTALLDGGYEEYSLFLIWSISEGYGLVLAKDSCQAHLMTKADPRVAMMCKRILRSTPITSFAALHGYFCSNCVKTLICTMLFASIATKTEVQDNVLSVTLRAAHVSSRLQSCSAIIAATESSCCFSVLSDSASSSIRIGIGGKLNRLSSSRPGRCSY